MAPLCAIVYYGFYYWAFPTVNNSGQPIRCSLIRPSKKWSDVAQHLSTHQDEGLMIFGYSFDLYCS